MLCLNKFLPVSFNVAKDLPKIVRIAINDVASSSQWAKPCAQNMKLNVLCKGKTGQLVKFK